MPSLYTDTLYDAFRRTVRRAVEEVEALDRRVFADAALAGLLQKIIDKYHLDVARLRKDKVTAVRRDTEDERPDGWGEWQKVQETLLDVTIPFSGDKESFLLRPSYTAMTRDAEIGESSLTLSVFDDAPANETVQSFIRAVSDNLELLRSEYEQMKPQLAQAVNEAAQRRKQRIEAETARDQTRSFKIVG